jgi:hypothetical protein
MPNSQTAALIAALSAVGGGVIVAASNYVLARFQAREVRHAELRRALIELWNILSRIDHRLRTEPQPGKTTRAINKGMAMLPQLDHSIGLTRRRLLEPATDQFIAEMHKAMAAATLLAPLTLLPSLSAVTDIMGEANEPDGTWQDRWNKACSALFVECRDLLGSGVIRAPARPGEQPDATDQRPTDVRGAAKPAPAPAYERTAAQLGPTSDAARSAASLTAPDVRCPPQRRRL